MSRPKKHFLHRGAGDFLKKHKPAGGRRGGDGDACRKRNWRQALIFARGPNKAFPGPLKEIPLSGDFYKREAVMETEKGGAARTGAEMAFLKQGEREIPPAFSHEAASDTFPFGAPPMPEDKKGQRNVC